MHFLSRTQEISAFCAAALVFVVLELVRRRRLSEEYSLLWVVASLAMAILGFFTPVLQGVTRLLGIRYESSTAFAFGVAFGILMLLQMSVQLSRMSRAQHALTRELALVRHELEALRGPGGAAQGHA
ncbi:MAG TPA: DUF2304 domain-containing protein [Candidatus Saccharimonadaceae bacterium]|jgi:hypothetical protein|nr:DUF2304 domain-containing protein [Candidatus Saccharimonadaceae bacterium]